MKKMNLPATIFLSLFLIVCIAAFPPSSFAQTPTPVPFDDTVDSAFLWLVNPLTITGEEAVPYGVDPGTANSSRFNTPGEFVNQLLPYIFTLAGFILFIMILWGGFEMLSGANDSKSLENGKTRITAAMIGFIILFCVYWIAQIVQLTLGVNILG